MPDPDADRMADTYWENMINRARQTEQNAQAYAVAQRQTAQEAVIDRSAQVEQIRPQTQAL